MIEVEADIFDDYSQLIESIELEESEEDEWLFIVWPSEKNLSGDNEKQDSETKAIVKDVKTTQVQEGGNMKQYNVNMSFLEEEKHNWSESIGQKYIISYLCNNRKVTSQLDSGADISVLSEKMANELNLKKKLLEKPIKICGYDGSKQVCSEFAVARINLIPETFSIKFHIVNTNSNSLIGNDFLSHKSNKARLYLGENIFKIRGKK